VILLPRACDVRRAHEIVVDRYGGAQGDIAQREGLIDSAIESVKNHILYRGELRIGWLAGLLCLRLANAHAFVDGNKRVAVFSMQLMLEANGRRIPPESQMPLYELVMAALTGKLCESEFCERIEALAVPTDAR